MISKLERRFAPVSLRAQRAADPATSAGQVVGYASTWRNYANLGDFVERCAAGCFARSLSRGADSVYACLGHDPNLIVGRCKNGTLRLREDENGLHHECDLAPTSTGKDVFALISRGDVNEMSFAFTVDPDDGEDWSEVDDPTEPDPTLRRRVRLRTLKNVQLMDVAYTPSPAYTGTSATAKAPYFNSARSFTDLFPDGAPLEVRSRVPNLRQNFEALRARRERETEEIVKRRRNLANLILSI